MTQKLATKNREDYLGLRYAFIVVFECIICDDDEKLDLGKRLKYAV